MLPRRRRWLLLTLLLLMRGVPGSSAPAAPDGPPRAEAWLTTEDRRAELASLPLPPSGPVRLDPLPAIEILPHIRFQSVTGMGASLEHSTCSNLFRMTPAERERALRLLLDPQEGIGMNLMRISLGTSDFTGDPWYSYSDLAPGETDPELRRFSIDQDRAYVLPMLLEARRVRPDLVFFASPWSPPGWMKTTGSMIGGSLKREWYPAYALYFVRFLQAYAEAGIPVHAITIQNEPGVDRAREKDPRWYYPSCHWTGEQERDFIRDHLGPALRRAGLNTRIWCYDHNFNREPRGDDAGIDHPRTILRDRAAARFVDGVAFHGYAGEPSGMSALHAGFPRVPLHFTEGSIWGLGGVVDLIERFRHHASSYNAWVSILDDRGRPNNGPFEAPFAILALDSATGRVSPRPEYFYYGHFMKFVPPGSVRVASRGGGRDLPHVAFARPDRARVVVVANTSPDPQALRLVNGRVQQLLQLPGKSVMTVVWSR